MNNPSLSRRARILVPSGALGLGWDQEALERGIAMRPDLIAIDGGSTDSGPSYLGRGVSKYSRASTKLEWAGLIDAAARAGCPLVIGTAGTCGADSAVDWMVEITAEILAERGETRRVAVLKSGQSGLRAADLRPLDPAPPVDDTRLADCTNIVALAGAEQIQETLNTGAEIIIAGRTTDTAIIAALPLSRGCHAGGAWHGAKIGECGALCATNPQSGVIVIDFDQTGFTVKPLANGARATPHTVSAHMLYENSDPFILYEPGGHLDVTKARYTALDDSSVRVEGSEWVPGAYTVKLEGARVAGYQVVSLAMLRDTRYVAASAVWCDDIQTKCTSKVIARLGVSAEDFFIELRRIGADATLGDQETRRDLPTEVGIMGLVTADTPELAQEIAKMLNPYLLHHPLTAQEEQPTFAFPFSPAEIERGPVYEFCLNHVIALDDPMSAFRLEVQNLG